jgi:hypothetical protein
LISHSYFSKSAGYLFSRRALAKDSLVKSSLTLTSKLEMNFSNWVTRQRTVSFGSPRSSKIGLSVIVLQASAQLERSNPYPAEYLYPAGIRSRIDGKKISPSFREQILDPKPTSQIAFWIHLRILITEANVNFLGKLSPYSGIHPYLACMSGLPQDGLNRYLMGRKIYSVNGLSWGSPETPEELSNLATRDSKLPTFSGTIFVIAT